MTYANHSNNPNLVVPRIENSVVAHSHATGRIETTERHALRRAWLRCQEVEGNMHAAEWTLATCARDPKAGEYYWRTYGDQTIRKVSLPALMATNTTIMRIGAGPSTGDFTPVQDATAELV